MHDGPTEQGAQAGWATQRLGDLAALVKGISYSSDQYCGPGEGAEFITIKCVSKAGGFRQAGIKNYSGPIRPDELLRQGDILIANTDLTRAGDIIGCPVLVPDILDRPVTMSMDLSKLVVDPKVVDARFLYHRLMLADARRFMRENSSGSTVLHLRTSRVPSFQVGLPTCIDEQRAIAQVLDTLDTTIRQTEAIIEKLKQVKQGLLHDLLTRGIADNGELRPPQSEAPHLYKESALGPIPQAWCVELLDEVAIRGSGHTPSKDVKSYWNGGIRWVSLADSHRLDRIYIDTTDKEISELGIANSSAVKHPAGTVVLSRDAGVGKSAILASEMAVSQHFMAWDCGDRLNNRYLYFKLQHMKPAFEAIALGSTVKTIGLDYFKKLRVAVPGRPEQGVVAAIMMDAEQTIRRHLVELGKLRELKTGLMDDLLTGRVRVTPLLEGASQ